MFIPSPLQLKAMLIGAAAAAIAMLVLLTWAFFERSRYMECRATTATLAAEVQVLADKIERQSTEVRATANAGREAVAAGRELLKAAQRANAAAQKAADRSDVIARGPAQPGKDCLDAWREIEAESAAETKADNLSAPGPAGAASKSGRAR